LVTGPSPSGVGRFYVAVCLRNGLRQNLGRIAMVLLTAMVTVFLFIYLLVALLRPEWF
jgi:K+-transporting ATPase KdpF subunit